jgi:hypothetical protein
MLARIVIVVAALSLAACATLSEQPPAYGCHDLEDYGCPTQPGQPDS